MPKTNVILLLVVLLASIACGQTAKFDMLDWMTLDPSLQAHLTGPNNPTWTAVDSQHHNLYWVKGKTGYPWDVKGYDASFIYDTITEVSWTDPRTFNV
jgi:hypothetical protein